MVLSMRTTLAAKCRRLVWSPAIARYWRMCGRIIQASGLLRYALVDGLDVPDTRMTNFPPRYNGAPGQDLLVIRQNPKTAERSLDPIRWGFVPRSTAEPKPKARPI